MPGWDLIHKSPPDEVLAVNIQPDILDKDKILSGLETRWLGRDLRLFAQIESTNEVARSLAQKGENGTVVLAETQSKGRGRLSRYWASPPGGIWMSLILRPKIPIAFAYQINMAVSAALCRAILTTLDLEAGIKWPNDIIVGEKKVGGILMEVSSNGEWLDYAIVGLGINANIDPSSFPDEWKATSLSHELGREISRTQLIQRALMEVETAYEMIGSDEVYRDWRRNSVTIGRMVRIFSEGGELLGKAEDLAEDGALLLKIDGGLVRILAGDCIHLRGMDRT